MAERFLLLEQVRDRLGSLSHQIKSAALRETGAGFKAATTV